MSIKTYNSKEVSIVFAGIPFEGYADGTFVTVARNNPQASDPVVGGDGEGARSMSNDKSGTITVTLMQTSKTNAALSAWAKYDERTGDGVAPMMVRDGSGTSVAAAETAYISKVADVEYSKEITNREWTFKTDNLESFVGEN